MRHTAITIRAIVRYLVCVRSLSSAESRWDVAVADEDRLVVVEVDEGETAARGVLESDGDSDVESTVLVVAMGSSTDVDADDSDALEVGSACVTEVTVNPVTVASVEEATSVAVTSVLTGTDVVCVCKRKGQSGRKPSSTHYIPGGSRSSAVR